MSTQFTMIGIMNAALLEMGQEEIVQENDGSLEWRTMARNWPLIVETELEDGAYNFTKDERHLQNRVPGKYGFEDGYLVPAAALHVRNLYVTVEGGRITPDWVQDGSYVYLNNPNGCVAEIVMVPGENIWSANFAAGVQKRLQATVLRAVKEEFGEADSRDAAAEYHFQRARTISSKSRSEKPLYRPGKIARARRGAR